MRLSIHPFRYLVLIGYISVMGLSCWSLGTARPAQAACGASLPTTTGTLTMNMSVSSAGTYRVWARILGSSSNINGFYLQIPDASLCNVTMGNASITANTWTWVDYRDGTNSSKINATLTAGSHQVLLAGLDDGLVVDKLLLATDAACIPTGDGSNCVTAATSPTPTPSAGATPGATPSATPTPVVIPASGGTTKPVTVSGTISIAAPSNTTNATCKVDGKAVNCAKIDTTALTDGNHTVEVQATDQQGKTVTKQTTIKVKNKLSLMERLVAGLQRYKWPIVAVVALTILIGGGWYIWYRLRPRPSIQAELGPTAAAPTGSPAVVLPTALIAPASSTTVLPNTPSDPPVPPSVPPTV
ncbi:MAG: hypothetical protein JWN01_1136 [Patescibacteria group bacterium]|nr:hypothetical protein [Patescibacteria group bacterium]